MAENQNTPKRPEYLVLYHTMGVSADFDTKRDLQDLGRDLTVRLNAAMAAVAPLLVGALHYWPPGHG